MTIERRIAELEAQVKRIRAENEAIRRMMAERTQAQAQTPERISRRIPTHRNTP